MTKTLAEGLTEDYTLSREALDIENVNNTSDANKPVSTATQTALNLKADTTTVNTALALKADTTTVNTALALKADTTTVNTALALKADTSTVNTALALKADTSAMNTALALKQDISSLNTAIDSRITARVISYDEVHFVRDAGGVDGGTEAANSCKATFRSRWIEKLIASSLQVSWNCCMLSLLVSLSFSSSWCMCRSTSSPW